MNHRTNVPALTFIDEQREPVLRIGGSYYKLRSLRASYMDGYGTEGELTRTMQMSAIVLPTDQSEFWGVPTIKKVIFNPPATIVIWADGKKTVVKAHNEPFDPEKGLAMAISNHILTLAGVNPHSFFREKVKQYTDEKRRRDLVMDQFNKALDKTMREKNQARTMGEVFEQEGWMHTALARLKEAKNEINPDK